MRSPRVALLVVAAIAVSGVGFPLVVSPPDATVWPHLVLWVPFALVLRRTHGVRALLAGWATGALVYAVGFRWLADSVERFTGMSPVVGWVVGAAFGVLWGFAYGVWGAGLGPVARATGRWWPVAGALWFAACEHWNPQLFPWTQAAPWYLHSEVFLGISLGGPALLTFAIVLINLAVVAAVERATGRPEHVPGALERAVATALVTVLVLIGWSHHRLAVLAEAEAQADPLRVALIQNNLEPGEFRALNKADKSGVVQGLADLSREALVADPDVDVVIWAEAAILGRPDQKRNGPLRALVRDEDVEVWTGASFRLPGERKPVPRRVGAFRVGTDGRVAGRYDKNVLLPFGEYMPLSDVFPILDDIGGARELQGGDEMTVFEDAPADFAFLICYEATRGRLTREAARSGAELLVNITYDGWFGDSECPHQHLMLAAAQAAATGIPMVRAAGTGISAIVDARGVPIATTDVFERTFLTGEVRPVARPSVYVALGDWVAYLATIAAFVALAIGATRRRESAAVRAAAVLLLVAPLAWAINPKVPWAELAAWGFAVLALVVCSVPRLRAILRVP